MHWAQGVRAAAPRGPAAVRAAARAVPASGPSVLPQGSQWCGQCHRRPVTGGWLYVGLHRGSSVDSAPGWVASGCSVAFFELKQGLRHSLASLSLSVTVRTYPKESETHGGKRFQEQDFRHFLPALWRYD